MTARNTVTSSRRLDRLIFVGILAFMLGLAPRILVYYRSTGIVPTRIEPSVSTTPGDRARAPVTRE